MEKMSLKDIQNVSLEILKDVHEFCVKNSIRYSLAYGTLIGAVRHNGFIPWDDDIDIFMPRPDYQRFCEIYSSKQYELISSYNRNSYLAYSRVCDMKITLVKEYVPWCNMDTGVWIDIFPLDGAEDNKSKFDKRYALANLLWHMVYWDRGAKRPITSDLNMSQIVKLIAKKVLFVNGIFLKQHLYIFNEVIQRCKFEDFFHWGQLTCCDNGSDEYNPISVFDDIIMHEFEQYNFCMIKDYDSVLKTQYGDYMKLPPLEKRVPKQSDMHFYWR